MRIYYSIVFACIHSFMTSTIFAQGKKEINEGFESGILNLGYVTKKTAWTISMPKNEKRRHLLLYGVNNDTVSVYLNGSLIYNKFISHREDLSSGFTCDVKLELDSEKFNYLTVFLKKDRFYVEMPIDSRYFFIKLHCAVSEKDDEFPMWDATFSNESPRE